MIYHMLQASQDLLTPMRRMARGGGGILANLDIDHPADLLHPLVKDVLPAWLPTNPANPTPPHRSQD
jgi:hypothetical protein